MSVLHLTELFRAMSKEAVNVAVVNLPSPRTRVARTLREIILKDSRGREYWSSRLRRKRSLSKGISLPPLSTMVSVPLQPDATSKLHRLHKYVSETATRSYLVYLPRHPSTRVGSATERIERWNAQFDGVARPILDFLGSIAGVRILDVDQSPLNDSTSIFIRPLRSLAMMIVDAPATYVAQIENVLDSSMVHYTAAAPVSMQIAIPPISKSSIESPDGLAQKEPAPESLGAGVKIGIVDTDINTAHDEPTLVLVA